MTDFRSFRATAVVVRHSDWGEADRLLTPVSYTHLLVAGNDLANEEHILETVNSLLALQKQVEKSLKSMGVTGELHSTVGNAVSASTAVPTVVAKKLIDKAAEAAPSPEMEALLKDAAKKKAKANEMDDFWNQAAEKHGSKPVNSEVISLEEARKLGLVPGNGK